MVCIQTRVKRSISRERRVRNVLSVSSMTDHLHVYLLDVASPVSLLQFVATTLIHDPTPVYQRDLIAKRFGFFEVVRGQQNRHAAPVQLPDEAPKAVA